MKSDNNRIRPTIREVAALSGTSIKTVSRVMNGVTTVDPVLVKKVKAAAAKINYRPNLTAGNLRRVDGRTNTIGLLLKDISNPFSSSLHRAIEDLARAEGFDLIAGSMDEMPEREAELISTFISRRVDGLLIVPSTSDHKYLEKERKSGLSFVFIDRPANNFNADAVVATNRISAKEATEHLIKYGHTRIAYMGDSQDIYTAAERFAGYKAALAKAKIKIDHSIIHHGVNDKEDIERFTNSILTGSNRVTAIFSSQNYVTIEAIRALAQRDLAREIALVGFDDLPFADLVKPGISLITQDIKKMAEVATHHLIERINGNKGKIDIHEIPTIFTARGSGEIRAPK
jgi:LacI family transcriptional regulator